MRPPQPPSYDGRGLVNLVAEIETRLTGSSMSRRLDVDLAATIPSGETYVLVLFDGLGVSQLDHPSADGLRKSLRGSIDAPFPSMTTVSLATIATGTPPASHGLTSYKLWLREHDTIVNTIHMTTAWGESISGLDTVAFLPEPNLWERVEAAGFEPIVVQPGNFAHTELTQTLYRGARFEPYWNPEDAVAVTRDVSSIAQRFVFLYVPYVDFAAHISGQGSDEYVEALTVANGIWESLEARLGPDVVMVGTADHGHVDIPESHRQRIDPGLTTESFISEDGRVLFFHGASAEADGRRVASLHGGVYVPVDDSSTWWGDAPHHREYAQRTPDGIVFLPKGATLFTDHGNPKLIGNHGGVELEEIRIPLLVGDNALR